MNINSFGIDNAVNEYSDRIVDVITSDCTSGVYITSCEPVVNDGIRFSIVEMTFYYVCENKYEKSFELLMYQQDFNTVDVVRHFVDFSSCFSAFNAVKF